MANWTLSHFGGGEVIGQGETIVLQMRMKDGSSHSLTLPFAQLDWLTQALIGLGQGAFQAQVAAGSVVPTGVIKDDLIVETYRVLPNTEHQSVTVQLIGRPSADSPKAMASAQMAPHVAGRLGAELTAAAQKFPRPS